MRVLSLIAACLVACSALAQAPGGERRQAPDFSSACNRLGARDASGALRWYRSAAEQRALYLQVFRLAEERLRVLAQSRKPGTWAVIADADETLLDNSEFQCELEASLEKKFDPMVWDQWVAAERATATPGAAEFVRAVRRLGGLLVVVSNRVESKHRVSTQRNFESLGMAPDAMFLAPEEGATDKNARFRSIAMQGLPGAVPPPPEIVMFLGDNIEDFPGLTQSDHGPAGNFGSVFFVMPNPIYGSWLRNTFR
jgi:acid phosphatase